MIKVNHLSKKFGNLEVLKDINLNINEGEVVCIIGPSGSGKSTFLRCINQLERPTGGTVQYEGKNLLDKNCDIRKFREEVGMVFQKFNLFPLKTVVQNVMMAPILTKHMNKEEAHAKALELLDKVGLKDKADVYPSTLSGGQQQRVAIARALAMKPKALLFDEPTSALDPISTSKIEELMEVRPEIIAMDATISKRPGNKTLEEFFHEVKERYPDQLWMADCSTVEEALHADELGFDFIGTTMVGYTEQSKGAKIEEDDFAILREIVAKAKHKVIAEGNINTPEKAKHVIELGAYSVVVGSIITRPQLITKSFVEVMERK